MAASNYVHLEDCLVKRLTERAAQIEFSDADGEVSTDWFPLSQIADGEDLEVGGPQTVSISEWIAKQKNLEVD